MQRKVSQDEVVAIIEDAIKVEAKGLRRHAEVHRLNANEASEDEMLS